MSSFYKYALYNLEKVMDPIEFEKKAKKEIDNLFDYIISETLSGKLPWDRNLEDMEIDSQGSITNADKYFAYFYKPFKGNSSIKYKTTFIYQNGQNKDNILELQISCTSPFNSELIGPSIDERDERLKRLAREYFKIDI